MRHLRSLAMVAALGLAVASGLAAGRREARGDAKGAHAEKPLIGMSLDTLQQSRWQRDRDAFVARAQTLGAEVLVQSANSDDARQIADVEALLSRGVDVLVVVAHDEKAMAKAIPMAHAAGVPVVAYDKIIRDCDLDLFMSFDNERVGELQARYVVEHLPTPGHGKIVRIYGARNDNNTGLLKTGQDRVLRPYLERGDIRVVHEDWADDWRPESAKRITNAAITRFGHGFDGVLASSDGIAAGAVQALLEEGLAGKVLVTGQDADLVALQRIVAGTQSMTVYKPLHELAERAAEVAIRLARHAPIAAASTLDNGRAAVPTILSGVHVVTRENLDQTVVRDGFYRHDEIFGAGR